ncbi:efflux RND transporter periplasmic adaptor subunit [Trichocoleus sp. FACHB-90]|uniref:efflux RND transporter periplasmic adaptor subunit n=1 Tax=Cyanophyceae TaxID=3028117 RepID=UPI0016880BBD|nr:efflux RND transporter periplasmic adaptor subunit [Trichocoleus sp. FACHB-90]MBD1929002.1 efflux RND transporter periplasmic adaptor subunit [Trichocoleus sp. FACHB-90]
MQLPLIGKVKNPSRWIIGLLASGILVASTTYFVMGRSSPQLDIQTLTVPVKSQSLKVRIAANGTVVPLQSVNLSPKTSGTLAKLYVEQGDKVQPGQKIAQMENRELQAQLSQAIANLKQAEARLAEAQAGSRPEEIVQAKARLSQSKARLQQAENGSRPEEIAQAQARLQQARSRLADAQNGRSTEIDQAKAQVEAAKARENLAQKRVKRYQFLADQGAVATDQLDEALTEYRNATANVNEAQRRLEQRTSSTSQGIEQQQAALTEAQQALKQLQSGTRSEEVSQRQADVAEAQSALRQLENGTRPEEIAQLKAAADAARASMQAVQVQLSDTVIVAPFAGIVTQKYAQEGAFVTPTTSASSTASATSSSIVALARDSEILAKVPEVDVGQIKQGQAVEIVADAYPDQVFKGKVRLIAPEAVVEQNVTSFQVRVALETGKEQLRSGMNVDLTFVGEAVNNALVVPTVAIVTEKGKTGVLIPSENNEPKFQEVTIGSTIENQTQILEGIKQGDRVFIDLPKDRKPKEE